MSPWMEWNTLIRKERHTQRSSSVRLNLILEILKIQEKRTLP